MNTDFPEHLFPSPDLQKVKQGIEICNHKKIIFCGICRNVAKTIEKNIKRITRTSDPFQEYRIFLYENDSEDETVDILKKLNDNENIFFTSENRADKDYRKDIEAGKDNDHKQRCKILAECRNKYLQFAKTFYNNYDYICILDLDIHGWSYNGFYESVYLLESDNDIGSVSSYGILSDYNNTKYIETCSKFLMYDSLAFRPFMFNGKMNKRTQSIFNLIRPNTTLPVRVDSNFGGLCLYKMKNILDVVYESKSTDSFVDCDHVCFNRKISNKGLKHFMNPNMVVSYSKHRFCND